LKEAELMEEKKKKDFLSRIDPYGLAGGVIGGGILDAYLNHLIKRHAEAVAREVIADVLRDRGVSGIIQGRVFHPSYGMDLILPIVGKISARLGRAVDKSDWSSVLDKYIREVARSHGLEVGKPLSAKAAPEAIKILKLTGKVPEMPRWRKILLDSLAASPWSLRFLASGLTGYGLGKLLSRYLRGTTEEREG